MLIKQLAWQCYLNNTQISQPAIHVLLYLIYLKHMQLCEKHTTASPAVSPMPIHAGAKIHTCKAQKK